MNDQIAQIINESHRIVVIQADNPDADSLGAALALEQILSEIGKDVYLYCSIETPTYLRYLEGWSRIMQDLPSNFDASIIVDASTITLLEKLKLSGQLQRLVTKPCIVIDHHSATDDSIYFAATTLNQPDKSSTGEVIYDLAKSLNWPIDSISGANIMTCILGDTQGLTNDLASAQTYVVMSELIALGVDRPALEEQRRLASKMDPKIFKYKADLILRTELLCEGKLALVTVPQSEINEYSPLYNPAPLIQTDMLQTAGVEVTVVMKHYDDGKILAAIRCNQTAPIAANLAKLFGGGGHPYASGFKLNNADINNTKMECISAVEQLLAELRV